MNPAGRNRSFPERGVRGFTLVELLVVIAIIGVLVGLLLPAVQAARESARLSTCSNSLKQIGLALHNFHDQSKRLPPWLNPPTGSLAKQWSWATYILPFIEQSALYDSLDVDTYSFLNVYQGTAGPEKQALLATKIDAMRCPSNRTEKVTDRRAPLAVINYAASRGYGQANWYPSATTPRTGHNNGAIDWDGVKFSDITDGLSKTIAIGEVSREFNQARADGYSFWSGVPDDSQYSSSGGATNLLAHKTISRAGSFRIASVTSGAFDWAFGTAHAKVANFLMCDGAVRPLSIRVDFNNNGCPSGWYGDTLQTDIDSRVTGMGVYQRLIMVSDAQSVTIPKP